MTRYFYALNNQEALSSAVHAVDVRIDRGDILFHNPFGDDLVRVLLGSSRSRRRIARRQVRSGADMLRPRAVRLSVGPSGLVLRIHSNAFFRFVPAWPAYAVSGNNVHTTVLSADSLRMRLWPYRADTHAIAERRLLPEPEYGNCRIRRGQLFPKLAPGWGR